MTELALDTALRPEQREYLETVRASADHLLSVVDGILYFSEVQADELTPSPVDFSLRATLQQVLASLTAQARQNRLELACEVSLEVPDLLVGDQGRLCQVIFNLVGNAIKFTEQGQITLRVKRESRSEDEVCLHFTVVDTGIGIPKDKLKVIFEPFSQVDNSTARKYGGIGLGLPISFKLPPLEKLDGQQRDRRRESRF